MDSPSGILIIACGALAHEIAALRRANGWAFDVQCLPPELHNRPERIAPAVREQLALHRQRYRSVFVAYAECGTGGALDRLLAEEGIERLPGAHCYEFYAGAGTFAALAEAEPGTFYLTDFLARHFERLVIHSLGIDRHPELAGEYFRNYRKLTYLAQTRPSPFSAQARLIAERLNLQYEELFTGFGGLADQLGALASRTPPAWQT
jgi:hypothetical protein